MRRFFWAALAGLLGGCGLEEALNPVPPQEARLHFYDPENALRRVYYRFPGGAWRLAPLEGKTLRLLLPSPTATFEVAAECGPSYRHERGLILFVRAEGRRLGEDPHLPCSLPRPYGSGEVSVPVVVSFPRTLGGTPLLSTDFFTFDGSGVGTVVPGGTATFRIGFPPGPQKASVLVYRWEGRDARFLGGKVFDLVAQEDRAVLVSLSEGDAVGSRLWAVSAPSRGSASARVHHFRDGMRRFFAASPFVTLSSGETGAGRYALFPGGGVYLGAASVSYGDVQGGVCGSSGCHLQAFLLEDTRGDNWTPVLPAPWPRGGLSVSPDGRTWSLGFPGASGYRLTLFLPEAKTVEVWTTSSTLVLPDLEPLFGFRYPTWGEVRFGVAAVAWGKLGDLQAPVLLSETRLRGLAYGASSLTGSFVLGSGGSF